MIDNYEAITISTYTLWVLYNTLWIFYMYNIHHHCSPSSPSHCVLIGATASCLGKHSWPKITLLCSPECFGIAKVSLVIMHHLQQFFSEHLGNNDLQISIDTLTSSSFAINQRDSSLSKGLTLLSVV